jgi:HAD superfamily hydrolase (TIGR01509 family)
MDGVLSDTDAEWERLGYDQMVEDYFGSQLASKVKITSGASLRAIYEEFVKLGWNGPYEDFHQANLELGDQIYQNIKISDGVDDLIAYLKNSGYLVGVVSSSPAIWLKQLTDRLANVNMLDLTLSVNFHSTLRPKPAPDPYLEACHQLMVHPHESVVLEDSDTGVKSALAAGATTICYTGYHRDHWDWQIKPTSAHYYAGSMREVRQIVENL